MHKIRLYFLQDIVDLLKLTVFMLKRFNSRPFNRRHVITFTSVGFRTPEPQMTRISPTANLGHNQFNRRKLIVRLTLMFKNHSYSTFAHFRRISVSTFVLFHSTISLLLGLQ